MKTANQSLPRIDVLNMLSKYAGYGNWQEFRYIKMEKKPEVKIPLKQAVKLLWIALLLVSVMAVLFILVKLINTQNYRFTFIDNDTGEPVIDNNLRAELIVKNESPVCYMSNETGSITIRTNKSQISMVVKAPYYLTDTVTRTLRKFNHDEKVGLNADYYALMIRYFSQSDVNSWEKRRAQLDGLLSEDAIIYQFPDQNAGGGVALYNKTEFIDKITMPSSGLRQIEIIDCRYTGSKIAVLRFRIKTDKE